MSNFYAVKKGKETGIYNSWNECNQRVLGYKGAIYKKFRTREDALAFINELPIMESCYDKNKIIYVDGGYNNFTKPYAYGCVVNGYGYDILAFIPELVSDLNIKRVTLPVGERNVVVSNFNDVLSQQNNGAELLATVIGMRLAIYFIKNGISVTHILSDSQLIVDHWSNKLNRSDLDPLKIHYINKLIELKKEFMSLGGLLIKISGEENLADLGFHI